jgi:rare lipoprotein A (peptidoglycan hydrolase)
MKISSSTAVLASAMVSLAGAVFGQAQTVSSSQQSMNFYVTTPQTGEQVVVGEGSQRPSAQRSQMASANSRNTMNTYVQQEQRAAANQGSAQSARVATNTRTARPATRQAGPANPGYSIQQVSNSPATAYSSSAFQHPAATYAPQASQSGGVVATSAQANYYTQTSQQTNPAYVSNASATTAQKPSLFSRIIHPGHAKTAPQAPASASSVWSNIKPSKLAGRLQQGMASWYGSDFHGGKTASGERYDMNSMTAAHKTLPFGTLVKVKNERNGRECVVRINNRGPFSKGRIIDLSKAAANKLGMVSSGVAKVSCEVIGRS